MKEFSCTTKRTQGSTNRPTGVPGDAEQRGPELWRSRDGKWIWHRGERFAYGKVVTRKAPFKAKGRTLDNLRRRLQLEALDD